MRKLGIPVAAGLGTLKAGLKRELQLAPFQQPEVIDEESRHNVLHSRRWF